MSVWLKDPLMAGPLHGDAVSPHNSSGPTLPGPDPVGLTDAPGSTSPFARWIDQRLPAISGFRRGVLDHPTPRNLGTLWNFGTLAALALAMLTLTGIFLSINYTPT